MRQSAKSLAAIAMIAASCLGTVSRAAFLESPRALEDDLDRLSRDMQAFAPIETFVDWLESSYGGPIDPGKSRR